VQFRLVIDVAWAVLLEVYREYGMKFDEATIELNKAVADPSTPEGQKAHAPEPNNDQSLAVLQAMMGGSDFGGPRG
jgi:hypothetical protein